MDKKLIELQETEREKHLEAILKSEHPKKIIVAGPGTGKTFTFGKLFSKNPGGSNLAMTFINTLADDLEADLGECAETNTFHTFCKRYLHGQIGEFQIVPYLNEIIERDAKLLGKDFEKFNVKLQMLEEGPEIEFYLERGKYYGVFSFDDFVYLLYKKLLEDPDILPQFDQIVIDEFQDFNPLEVALINELEKKSPILIVGDDDQAVYDKRCSSPSYLREKYESGEYEVFKLPFCSRCPEVIVSATNKLIEKAIDNGYLQKRIDKPFECFIRDTEVASLQYPKLIFSQFKTARLSPKYIETEIKKINSDDIKESYKEGDEYPTVLIVGYRHYLNLIWKILKEKFQQIEIQKSSNTSCDIKEGYRLILEDRESNLGWRILLESFLPSEEFIDIFSKTIDGTPITELIGEKFRSDHLGVVEIIDGIDEYDDLNSDDEKLLQEIIGSDIREVIEHCKLSDDEEEQEFDKSQPKILLTTHVGCKGLSAGHVFIVGVNNGEFPRNPDDIQDLEISKMIVALTRTRKQCHLLSNRWFWSPYSRGKYLNPMFPSVFLDWIPNDLIDDKGLLESKDIK